MADASGALQLDRSLMNSLHTGSQESPDPSAVPVRSSAAVASNRVSTITIRKGLGLTYEADRSHLRGFGSRLFGVAVLRRGQLLTCSFDGACQS